MPPVKKSRPSVAKELILALSKPKTAQSSTGSNKNSLASNQGPKEPEKGVSNNSPKTNNDWISYLKIKQQNASKNSPCATPSKLANKGNSTPFKSAVDNDNAKNKEVIEKSHNDKKLSTLLDQVKSLETNLGEKIIKLEATLKNERSKNRQLEQNFENELKAHNESRNLINNLESDKSSKENLIKSKTAELGRLKQKLDDVSLSLKSSREESDDDAKLKDVEILEILRENDELIEEQNNFRKWKVEFMKKLESSVQFCKVNHICKLNSLLKENRSLKFKLSETKLGVKSAFDEISELLKKKEIEIEALKAKLKEAKELKTKDEETIKNLEMKFFETNLRAVEMEKQLKNRNRSDSDSDKSNSETPSCDMAKDEPQKKPTASKNSATTSLNFDFLGKVSRNMKEVPDKTSRKRKKSVTEKTPVKKSKNVEPELEEEIKCIEVVQKTEIEIKKPLEDFETMKKTKAELRDAILSCLYKNSPEDKDREEVIELDVDVEVPEGNLEASKDQEIEIDDDVEDPGHNLEASGIQVVEMDDVEKEIDQPLKIESVTSQLFIVNESEEAEDLSMTNEDDSIPEDVSSDVVTNNDDDDETEKMLVEDTSSDATELTENTNEKSPSPKKSPVWRLKEWPKFEKPLDKTRENLDAPDIQDVQSVKTKIDVPCDDLLREDETGNDGSTDNKPQEVNVDILYGDLEELVVDETSMKKEESSKYLNPMFSQVVNENIDEDCKITSVDLDDSFESQDSNQLVIDLDSKEGASESDDDDESFNTEFLIKLIMDTVVEAVMKKSSE